MTARVCPKCTSEKWATDAYLTVVDGKGGHPEVCVDGDPRATIMTETEQCKMRASLCGECGYMEFFATNAKLLYATWLKASNRY